MSPRVLFAASLLGVFSLSLSAQTEGAGRCLHGQTVDSSGVALDGVSVMVSQPENNITHAVTSGSGGQFDLCGLTAGSYQVSAHKDSYQNSSRAATVQAGADTSLTLALSSQIVPPQTSAPAVATGEFHAGIASASSPDLPDAPASTHKNLPHGKVYGLLGSAPFNAQTDPLHSPLPAMEYGASIGGSFGQGRTSYFLSYDQFALNQPKLLSILAAAQAYSENPMASSALTARLDHKFGEHDTATLRFNRDDLRSYSLHPGENGDAPTLKPDFKLNRQQAAGANTVTLGDNTVNETRAQYVASETRLPAGTPDLGIQSDLPTVRRDRVFEAANNIYKQLGGHSLRMGGDFMYGQMNLTFLESSLGRTAGNSSFSQSGHDAALYVQGQHKLRSNLVATTGIRYDVQSIQGIQRDVNNFAPQLGLAWSPTSHTVIRGGVGMYYDQVPLLSVAGTPDSSLAADIANSGHFVSRNGSTPQDLASFTLRSPTMQNSYAETASVSVEQQIGAKSAITAETQYVRGVQLMLPVSRPASPCISIRDCSFSNVSTYTGSTIAFTQQPTRWGNYKVAYTYAKAQGGGDDTYASSLFDRMRRLSFTGVLHTSSDPASNLRQRFTRGIMLTGTTDYTQRSEFAGMSFMNLNTRFTKAIAWGQHYRLEALAETSNTFQRINASFLRSQASMGADAAAIFATYKYVAALQSPNSSRVGMRLTF